MSGAGYFKARRERAKADGLCSWCLCPSDGQSLCDSCRAKRAANYKRARAAKRCTKCKRPSGGAWACPLCRDRSPVKETSTALRGRWHFTDHAISQFLERHGASTGVHTRADALAWMRADSNVARHIHDNEATGSSVWAGARPWSVRYVIGQLPEHLRGNPDAKPPVVTVLPNERRSC